MLAAVDDVSDTNDQANPESGKIIAYQLICDVSQRTLVKAIHYVPFC